MDECDAEIGIESLSLDHLREQLQHARKAAQIEKAKREEAEAKMEEAEAKREEAEAKKEEAQAKREEAEAKREVAEASATAEKAKREVAEESAKAEKAKREEAEAKRKEAEESVKAEKAKREEAENLAAKANGTYFVSLCDLALEKTQNFSEMPDEPPHERPELWKSLLKKIPDGSLEHEPTCRANVPTKVRNLEEDVFGCSCVPTWVSKGSELMLPDEKFPAAHILAQGNLCRKMLRTTVQYLCGGEELTDFQMKRLLFGFKEPNKTKATLKFCIFQQAYNFIRYRDQFVTWDSRNAAIFLPEMSWLEQLFWKEGQEYSAFFLALTPQDFVHASPLNGVRVKIVDLSVDDNRSKFDSALKAGAEGLIQILRRNLPVGPSPVAETPSASQQGAASDEPDAGNDSGADAPSETEPFDGKIYIQTLQAIAKQGYVHVLSLKGIPEDAKVIRVNFTSKMAPHPAFLTTKGINAVINLQCMKSKIDGLEFSPDKAAIAIPGCLAVEGPGTSCGLCRFHFANTELGGCERLADYFALSEAESDLDDVADVSRADENTTPSAPRGEWLLSGHGREGSPTAPSQRCDSKGSTSSGPDFALRELSPNTT